MSRTLILGAKQHIIIPKIDDLNKGILKTKNTNIDPPVVKPRERNTPISQKAASNYNLYGYRKLNLMVGDPPKQFDRGLLLSKKKKSGLINYTRRTFMNALKTISNVNSLDDEEALDAAADKENKTQSDMLMKATRRGIADVFDNESEFRKNEAKQKDIAEKNETDIANNRFVQDLDENAKLQYFRDNLAESNQTRKNENQLLLDSLHAELAAIRRAELPERKKKKLMDDINKINLKIIAQQKSILEKFKQTALQAKSIAHDGYEKQMAQIQTESFKLSEADHKRFVAEMNAALEQTDHNFKERKRRVIDSGNISKVTELLNSKQLKFLGAAAKIPKSANGTKYYISEQLLLKYGNDLNSFIMRYKTDLEKLHPKTKGDEFFEDEAPSNPIPSSKLITPEILSKLYGKNELLQILEHSGFTPNEKLSDLQIAREILSNAEVAAQLQRSYSLTRTQLSPKKKKKTNPPSSRKKKRSRSNKK